MLFKSLAAAAAFGVASAENFIPVLVGMSPDGNAGTFFSPDRVTASVGSIVQFQFMGGNHTVTQSTFDQPCIPISTTNTSAIGVHSGFFPAMNNNVTGMVPSWNLQINDTRPLWLYCAQGRHCQSGMVMVINENTNANQTRSLDTHRTLAASAPDSQVPDGSLVSGGNGATGGNDPNNVNGGNNGQDQPAAGAAAGLRVSMALIAAVAGTAFFAI